MDKKNQRHIDDTRIAWHPAFYKAIQMSLEPYKDVLEFKFEYQLTAEPLQMDVLIIKKEKDAVIEKDIAAIFRGENILEFKSPDDYISIGDFYKVYGYACLYAALNKTAITDLTISFVEARHPRELLRHLKEVRGYRIEEKWPGVYWVTGDIIPIQIIESKKLSAEDNIWLKDLSNDLDIPSFTKLTLELAKQDKAALLGAYIQAVFQANFAVMQEALEMNKATISLDQVLENAGLTAKWEARGEARGVAQGMAQGVAQGEEKKALEIIKKALEKGMPIEDIADLTGYTPDMIAGLVP